MIAISLIRRDFAHRRRFVLCGPAAAEKVGYVRRSFAGVLRCLQRGPYGRIDDNRQIALVGPRRETAGQTQTERPFSTASVQSRFESSPAQQVVNIGSDKRRRDLRLPSGVLNSNDVPRTSELNIRHLSRHRRFVKM